MYIANAIINDGINKSRNNKLLWYKNIGISGDKNIPKHITIVITISIFFIVIYIYIKVRKIILYAYFI